MLLDDLELPHGLDTFEHLTKNVAKRKWLVYWVAPESRSPR